MLFIVYFAQLLVDIFKNDSLKRLLRLHKRNDIFEI